MLRKFPVLLLLGLLLNKPVLAIEPDWLAYSQLLDRHTKTATRQGIPLVWVDYSGLQHSALFDQSVEELARFSPSQLQSREERLAFYINAYNILAIKMVLDHWPLQSIRDAGSWLRPVWRKTAGVVGGQPVTLHQLEHEILRPMGEPRIHMAIVCASLSCPDLAQEPYQASKLEAQLERQTRNFLFNPHKGVTKNQGAFRISRIFDWFEEDFDQAGGLQAWLQRYLDDVPAAPAGYLPYLWALNGS